MPKSSSLMVDFRIVILRQFPSSVTSYPDEAHYSLFALRSYFTYLFTRLFVQKLVSTSLMPLRCCAIGCQTVYFSGCGRTFHALIVVPGMTSSLAKCEQVFGRALLDVFKLLICVIFLNMQMV